MTSRPLRATVVAALACVLALVGCGQKSDPLGNNDSANAGAIVVGSQQYYSNEIIAELYAQALEAKGLTVKRQFQIGQREVYMPELQDGRIDVLPEYAGNLLQYVDKSATAKTSDEIAAALPGKLPSGLRPLKAAEATDQDSYAVTRATADQYGLRTLADLSKLPQPVKIAGNSELAKRPYGPDGLQSVYQVRAAITPVEDSGGPLTVKALVDGTVNAADIYTADPAIAKNDLVALEDPEHLVLPQNVTPVVSKKVDDKAASAIEAVNAKLSTDQLIKLNQQSVDKQAKSADIAKQWLKEQGLV